MAEAGPNLAEVLQHLSVLIGANTVALQHLQQPGQPGQAMVEQQQVNRLERRKSEALRDRPIYYHDATKTWEQFWNERVYWQKAHGLEGIPNAEALHWHKATLMGSMKKRAATVSAAAVVQTDFENAVSWEEFCSKVYDAFNPQAESDMARQEYKGYKQGARQTVSEYISRKRDLFYTAYRENERNIPTLLEEICKGIKNTWVREGCMEKFYTSAQGQGGALTVTGMSNFAISLVAAERAMLSEGIGHSANYDGLRATTNRRYRDHEEHDDDVEDMEVGAIREKGTCYNCGKTGHLKRDCKSKAGSNTGARPKQGKGTFKGDCRRCGRTGHKKVDCYVKKHRDGTVLTDPAPGKAPRNQDKMRPLAEDSEEMPVLDVNSSSDSDSE